MLNVGDKAPEFTLLSDSGETVSLTDYLGKKVVLYFYPKDNTSGCTAQAIEFTSLVDEFTKANTIVIGVSPDSVQSHVKFKEKQSLNIILLSDTENEVAIKYSAYGEKSMYGKKYMGIIRSTFLISEEGIIESAEYKVKAKGNAEKTLCQLQK